MGEIKSVKVDNWGVFFLQKLQNFFNKTDYCDLTLQFRDNSQLKVHRLVLSACTDYFNVLEQTCELVDDALIMPNELQADVVVPIVNFMYTGTLEFELKMYGKLLRTAKEMNMTVLLKLLEAHRRTMEGVNRAQRPPSPKAIRRRNIVPGQSPQQQPPLPQQRRILTSPNTAPQRRFVQTKTIATNASSSTSTSPQQPVQYRQQIGSTSLLKTSGSGGLAVGTGQIRAQYGNITVYETTQQQQQHHVVKQEPEEPFEQLRKGYNNNKRPLTSTIISPPAKKPNIEDVKEFAEQQRMRKQIAAEYGDDVGEYESSMLDDDIHLDDDDDDATGAAAPLASSSTVATAAVQATSTKSVSSQGTTITINQSDKPPTIVVKDSTNSKMNHAKIIKEVLRQYPELVKTNKNIRLKIMPNPHDQAKIIIKKEPVESEVGVGSGGGGGGGGAQQQPQQSLILRTQQPAQTHAQAKPPEKTLTQQQQQTQKLSPPTPKQMPAPKLATAVAPQTNTVASSATPAGQKRRIDSKTMHALIALGAENTTGPWLCLRCGVNGRPISIPSYRGFRRHLINTHKETIDAALCEHCGWRSSNNRELHYHMEVEHKVKTPLYTFPECLMCAEVFVDTSALNQHMVDAHPDENKQQCIYCNKIFAREMQLYTHMKTFHKQQAIEDGIIDYSDEEFPDSQDEQDLASSEQQHQQSESKDKKESKVKILSDISLPIAGSLLKLEPSSEANALSTVASGIAASINISNAPVEFMDTSETGDVGVPGSEPKFVNVDGNEMVLTAEQRKEIMSQLNQEHGAGGVVMVLNEPGAYPAEAVVTQPTATVVTTVSEQKDTEVETEVAETTEEETGNVTGEGSATEEDFDDSQIYNEFNTQNSGGATATATVVTDEGAGCERAEKKNASGTLDESKESMENLEWAENLISAQEAAEQKAKNDDVINQKLKELTGDWTDDENDDEELPAAAANVIPPKPTTTGKEDVKPTSQAGEPAVTEDKEQEKVAAEGHEEDESQPAKSSPDEMKDESTVEDAVETDDSKTEATGESTANLDDSKTDEDDIDILMKSLHKDDTSDALKAEEKSEKQQEEPEVEADADEDDAKSERSAKSVDKEVGKAADFGDAVKVDIKSEKVSPGKKEKTVKKDESGVSAEDNATDPKTAEPKEENVDAAPSMKSEKTSPLVAAVERDALLAELIGQPDSLLDEQEFLSEPEQKSANAADTVAVSPAPVDLEEAVKEEAQPEKSGVEPMETDADEDVEAAVTETTATAAAADEDAAEKTTPIDSAVAAVTPTPSKTADTVKSLISEWADDDDDAEQL